MNYHSRRLLTYFFTMSLLAVVGLWSGMMGCGNGGSGDSQASSAFDPNETPVPEESPLAEQAYNTFLDNGIQITVDPTYYDFGSVVIETENTTTVTLANGTSDDITLTLNMTSLNNAFHITEEEARYGYLVGIEVAAGQSRDITVVAQPMHMGTYQGGLLIHATKASGETLDGEIFFPTQVTVEGSGSAKLIRASSLCTDEDPEVPTALDFKKVATGETKTMTVKLCNVGGDAIAITDLTLSANSSGLVSEGTDVDNLDDSEPFNWEPIGGSGYASSCSYVEEETFVEPEYVEISEDEIGDVTNHFTVERRDDGDIVGAEILGGGNVVFEINFAPQINVEPDDGEIFEPANIAADLNIETDHGSFQLGLVGAATGLQPILKLQAEETDGTLVDIDLEDGGPAVDFGTTYFFSDLATDIEAKSLNLVATNTGSATQPLQLWVEGIADGPFAFTDCENTSLPLALDANESGEFAIQFQPANDGSEVSDWHLGQLNLKHNGSTGPHDYLVLLGETIPDRAITLKYGSDELGDTVSADGTTYEQSGDGLSLCRLVIPGSDTDADGELEYVTTRSIILANNSDYALTSSVAVTVDSGNAVVELDYTGATEGVDAEDTLASATASDSTSVTVSAGSTTTVTMAFRLNDDVARDNAITGNITLSNGLSGVGSGMLNPNTYSIDFYATASDLSSCGASDGEDIVFLIDRIIMILPPLSDPNHNPTAAKHGVFHMDLDLESGMARSRGVPFNMWNQELDPVEEIRSYAHQITVPDGQCFPLPTSPAYSEYEGNSWDGPNQCTYTDLNGDEQPVGACIPNNGSELYTDADGALKEVYYYDFTKFDSGGSCTQEYEGQIASFAHAYVDPEDYRDATSGEIDYDALNDAKRHAIETTADEVKALDVSEAEAAEAYDQIINYFGYGSYITFYRSFICTDGKTYHGSTTNPVTVSAEEDGRDAVKACYQAVTEGTYVTPSQTPRRVDGYVGECSYFWFYMQPGEEGITRDTLDPDNNVGVGEYEVDEETGGYHATFYNVEVGFYVLSHGAQFSLFSHASNFLIEKFNATFTTHAIGGDDDDIYKYVSVEARDSFTEDDVRVPTSDSVFGKHFGGAITEYMGPNGLDPDGSQECPGYDPNARVKCGAYEYVDEDHVVWSGDPFDPNNSNRGLLVAVAATPGDKRYTPSFIVGYKLRFAFQGCLISQEELAALEATGDRPSCYNDYYSLNLDPDSGELTELTGDYRVLPMDWEQYYQYYAYRNSQCGSGN